MFADGLLHRRTRAAVGAALIAVGLTVGVCAFGASWTLHAADIHGLTQAGLTGVDRQPFGTEHRVTYTRDGRIRHGTIRLGDTAATLTETADWQNAAEPLGVPPRSHNLPPVAWDA